MNDALTADGASTHTPAAERRMRPWEFLLDLSIGAALVIYAALNPDSIGWFMRLMTVAIWYHGVRNLQRHGLEYLWLSWIGTLTGSIAGPSGWIWVPLFFLFSANATTARMNRIDGHPGWNRRWPLLVTTAIGALVFRIGRTVSIW